MIIYFEINLPNFLEDFMKVTPLADRVLVKTEKTESKTASGIIIPDTAQEKTQIATVIAVGDDKEKIKVNKFFLKNVCEYLEQLKTYKDAEEQGLLLKLPCKVGTHIYMINRYWIDEGHIYGIAEADDIDCFCFKVYCDPDDYTMVAIADFNETWFLTREEAEKALADMGV